MVNERRWLALIFALYFLLAFGYSVLMPIWEAPDEPAHYHMAWHFVRYGEYQTVETNYEAHQPRGFYYLAAGVIRALSEVDPELTRFRRPDEYPFTIRKPERRFDWNDSNYRPLWGVYVLRWVNMGFGGIALGLHWKTFKQISPEKTTLCLAALALTGLTPQYLHIMSAVNNDALGTLAGALLFYLAVRIAREAPAWLTVVSVPLALVLPFVTKLSVLPVSAAVLLTLLWKWFSGRTQRGLFLYASLLMLVGAGMAFLLFPEMVQSAAHQLEWRLFSFRDNAFTKDYIEFITSQIVWTYWAKVGWLAVGPPAWMIHLLTALGIGGICLHAYRLLRSGGESPSIHVWSIVWLIASLSLLAVFRNGLTTRATQGRLLFPGSGALSLLMMAGWHEVLPQRFQPLLPAIVILLLLTCNMVLWLTGVLPIYYQPFLD